MKKKKHIFSEDIEMPDIVLQKAETAFSKIKLEDQNIMYHSKKNKNSKKKTAPENVYYASY